MGEKEPRKQIEGKDAAHFLRRNRIARYPSNVAFRISLYLYLISTPDGRDVLRDPNMRRNLYDQEKRVGLLEDSIFSNDLYYPNEEETSLSYKSAVAGRWIGYDFNRPAEFGPIVKKKGRQLQEGRLYTFPLPEIITNSPDIRTSSYLLDIFRLEHILLIETPSIGDLLNYGFVEESTYKETYERTGQYNRYKQYLSLAGITDSRVYRVTPKGSSLVVIKPDIGERKKEPEAKRVLSPVFGT